MLRKSKFILSIITLSLTAAAHASSNTEPSEHKNYLYTQTNSIEKNSNAIAAYEINDNGSLRFIDFYKTQGTGINNNTNGKLGPQDNDSQIIITADKQRLYTVNINSNTIAGFNIHDDGSLTAVPGSPFSSHGVAPVSINISNTGSTLMAANRNEDYHQPEMLNKSSGASYASFKINEDGSLTFVDKVEVANFQKPTQIHASKTVQNLFFGNNFQVDADFDGPGKTSFLAGPKPSVHGQLSSYKVDAKGNIQKIESTVIPETIPNYLYIGSPGVPSMPLGIWDHPMQNILYVGFVTRNQLGVYTYDNNGFLNYKTAVPNSGQDICWVLINKAATRLYTVNNLPRLGSTQQGSTISVYDISGDKALEPVEIQVMDIPAPGKAFINNRMVTQPASTAFEIVLSPDEKHAYVINQRVDQTDANQDPKGNAIYTFSIDTQGTLKYQDSHDLSEDNFPSNSRTHGAAVVNR